MTKLKMCGALSRNKWTYKAPMLACAFVFVLAPVSPSSHVCVRVCACFHYFPPPPCMQIVANTCNSNNQQITRLQQQQHHQQQPHNMQQPLKFHNPVFRGPLSNDVSSSASMSSHDTTTTAAAAAAADHHLLLNHSKNDSSSSKLSSLSPGTPVHRLSVCAKDDRFGGKLKSAFNIKQLLLSPQTNRKLISFSKNLLSVFVCVFNFYFRPHSKYPRIELLSANEAAPLLIN